MGDSFALPLVLGFSSFLLVALSRAAVLKTRHRKVRRALDCFLVKRK